jgi:steroid 5-alpha reductase family enzyme
MQMIDPYWTVIPVMLVHYYAAHPLAHYDFWRSRIVILLTWVWSIRLIHNYFRREKWQLGAREDWRFTDMIQQYGKHWWWASFFSIYLPHQLLLIGLSLPFYVIHSVNQPLNIWDLVAVVVCVSGILIAYFADNQLYNFVNNNGNGMILESGLWYYTRHPNYFGEQLWWWGLVVFGWNLGHGWTFIGALLNTMCLGYVTKLVEQRMLKQDKRVEAYRKYQNTTSVWIPCFKFNSSANLPLKKTKNA